MQRLNFLTKPNEMQWNSSPDNIKKGENEGLTL